MQWIKCHNLRWTMTFSWSNIAVALLSKVSMFSRIFEDCNTLLLIFFCTGSWISGWELYWMRKGWIIFSSKNVRIWFFLWSDLCKGCLSFYKNQRARNQFTRNSVLHPTPVCPYSGSPAHNNNERRFCRCHPWRGTVGSLTWTNKVEYPYTVYEVL